MFKSLLAASAAMSISAIPAIAGPYVNVEANSGFVGSDYTGTTTDMHVGYEDYVENLSYYVQAGPTLVSPDGGTTETEFGGKVGLGVAATENITVYGEISWVNR